MFDSGFSESTVLLDESEQTFKVPDVPPTKNKMVDPSASAKETAENDWYATQKEVLEKASYLTSPSRSELFAQIVNDLLQDYQKFKEEGDHEIMKMQELIQATADKTIGEIATKWSEECAKREEDINLKLQGFQERMSRTQCLETELGQFTDGMKEMYRLMQ